MKVFKLALLGCALSASALFTTAARADAVLFLHYGPTGDSYTSYGNELASFIDAAPSSTVTVGYMSSAIYDLSSYNQIWVYDLNGGGANGNANVLQNSQNIASWYNNRVANNAGDNLILDGRILSSAYSVDETQLIQSFYNNFAGAGGGLLLGTDHCPDWCSGINGINSLINVGAFTGNYGSASYAIMDTASTLAQGVPCTTTLGNTGCFIYSNTSTGFAPAGLQGNGQFLTPFAYNTTNPNNLVSIEQAYSLTAISSTFGSVTFGTQVPEPATLALFGAGLLGLAAARRRRQNG